MLARRAPALKAVGDPLVVVALVGEVEEREAAEAEGADTRLQLLSGIGPWQLRLGIAG